MTDEAPNSRRQVLKDLTTGLLLASAAPPALGQKSVPDPANSTALPNLDTAYPKPPFPAQHQEWPGLISKMTPRPDHGETSYKGSGRLTGRKALLTGGDRGMGRAAAIAFAREGADVAINYLPQEESDAKEVMVLIREAGRKAVALQKVKGGGPLYDIGIYCINAARAMLGEEPRSVLATATRSRDRRFREIEENVAATMRFRDERLASFNCSFGAADRATYTVTGTHGSVTLDSAYEYVDAISSRVRIGEREQTRQFGKRDQFAAELEYFSQCILDNRTPEPSGAEGLADVRIIEAMHRSIRSGRWVEVKMSARKRRPTVKQNIRRPPVPSEPDLVDVKAASQ